mgnify:CR=1 FL=1
MDNKDRIKWIDTAKGIGILLVIIGHTVEDYTIPEFLTRGLIYSFHMPLFFILSGITFRQPENYKYFWNNTRKSFKRLITPVLIVFSIQSIIGLNRITSQDIGLVDYVVNRIRTLIYSSGVAIHSINVEALGMTWFLVALFLSKLLYSLIGLIIKNKYMKLLTIIICNLIGVIISEHYYLPLVLDLVLVIQLYLDIGVRLQKVDMKHNSILQCTICVLLWLFIWFLSASFTLNYTEMASRRYILFLLNYIIEYCGTLFVCYLCICIDRFRITKVLNYLGRNSMTLFCVHSIEESIIQIWNISDIWYINIIIRLIFDLCVFAILMRLRDKYSKL